MVRSFGSIRYFLEAIWKQSLYKRRPYVICWARLRTDLLDNRSLVMLLEISKRLIYWILVSGQPLSVNGSSPIALQYDADSLLTKAGDLTLSRDTQNGL